jgi:hypothetical protein
MGTRFTIVCHADERADAEKSAEAVFSIAKEVDAIASDYRPDSELSRLAEATGGLFAHLRCAPIVVPIFLSRMISAGNTCSKTARSSPNRSPPMC